MAKRKTTTTAAGRKKAQPRVAFDTSKFENIAQIGGIQAGLLECPNGSGQMRRVALVNTGSPLRFTVFIDRGGDIVDAAYGQHSLVYLTPNVIKAPNHAYNQAIDWIYAWGAGLMTSCGPLYIGHPREEDGQQVGLHGHHSNTPAAVDMIVNPDPHRGRHEMLICMTIRDSRFFGPIVEVRRTIACTLGVAEIRVFDEITNRGNERCPHNWLYHCNFGYPLLDSGTRLIYSGPTGYVQSPPRKGPLPTAAQFNKMKQVGRSLPEHAGTGERVLLVDPKPAPDKQAHIGLVNRKLGLALEMSYPTAALPRLANWQHLSPNGSYVTGLEPYCGSLLGKNAEDHPKREIYLDPGQTRRYELKFTVHDTPAAISRFEKLDGPLTVA